MNEIKRSIRALARLTSVALYAALLLMACVRSPWQYDHSEGSQPHLFVDTIRLDTLYSTLSSATHVAVIYNPHDHPLLPDEVSLLSGGNKGYRINVDGHSGSEIQDVTLSPRDSIFVLVEATFAVGNSDLPALVTGSLLWRCNGITHYTRIEGYRQNVSTLPANWHIAKDTLWRSERPYLITDSITIEPGARLTIAEGGYLLLPQGGRIIMRGALTLTGSATSPTLIEGIRRDNLTTDVSCRLLPSQWDYIQFMVESQGNKIRHTAIRNEREGVTFTLGNDPLVKRLLLESNTITNMGGDGLTLVGGSYTLRDSELSNMDGSCLSVRKAIMQTKQMTMVCDYLFGYRRSPVFYVGKENKLQMINSIVDGRQTIALRSDTPRRSDELAWHPSAQA